ncbi:hypothetical protein BC940DRAFT_296564 [Gongronella butleri]|nr:hypothetical protein BC940DRAFT_296564 [Gongronella butleri]
MRALVALLLVNILWFVAVLALGENNATGQAHDAFCIEFFHDSNQQTKNGFICDTVAPGASGTRPKKYLSTVTSIKAPDWLKVTLYNDFFLRGDSVVYTGSVGAIDPPMIVKSVHYENTNTGT